MVQEGVELGPWRSQQFKGIPELQKNGLQAVEEAWMTISRLRHFSVKFGRFLSLANSRKIRILSLRVCLASPEGRKVAQIGSLAQCKSLDSRPSVRRKGFES